MRLCCFSSASSPPSSPTVSVPQGTSSSKIGGWALLIALLIGGGVTGIAYAINGNDLTTLLSTGLPTFALTFILSYCCLNKRVKVDDAGPPFIPKYEVPWIDHDKLRRDTSHSKFGTPGSSGPPSARSLSSTTTPEGGN